MIPVSARKLMDKYTKAINPMEESPLLHVRLKPRYGSYSPDYVRIPADFSIPNGGPGIFVAVEIKKPFRIIRSRDIENKLLHYITRQPYPDTNKMMLETSRFVLDINDLPVHSLNTLIDYVYTSTDPRVNYTWIAPLQDLVIQKEGKTPLSRAKVMRKDIPKEHLLPEHLLPNRAKPTPKKEIKFPDPFEGFRMDDDPIDEPEEEILDKRKHEDREYKQWLQNNMRVQAAKHRYNDPKYDRPDPKPISVTINATPPKPEKETSGDTYWINSLTGTVTGHKFHITNFGTTSAVEVSSIPMTFNDATIGVNLEAKLGDWE